MTSVHRTHPTHEPCTSRGARGYRELFANLREFFCTRDGENPATVLRRMEGGYSYRQRVRINVAWPFRTVDLRTASPLELPVADTLGPLLHDSIVSISNLLLLSRSIQRGDIMSIIYDVLSTEDFTHQQMNIFRNNLREISRTGTSRGSLRLYDFFSGEDSVMGRIIWRLRGQNVMDDLMDAVCDEGGGGTPGDCFVAVPTHTSEPPEEWQAGVIPFIQGYVVQAVEGEIQRLSVSSDISYTVRVEINPHTVRYLDNSNPATGYTNTLSLNIQFSNAPHLFGIDGIDYDRLLDLDYDILDAARRHIFPNDPQRLVDYEIDQIGHSLDVAAHHLWLERNPGGHEHTELLTDRSSKSSFAASSTWSLILIGSMVLNLFIAAIVFYIMISRGRTRDRPKRRDLNREMDPLA